MSNTISRKENLMGVALLVIAAMLWGGEFAVAKHVLEVIPPNWLNMIRTAAAWYYCLEKRIQSCN